MITLRHYTQEKVFIEEISRFSRLSYAYTEGGVGALELVLPASEYSRSDFSVDDILEVFCQLGGRVFKDSERSYFIRDFKATKYYLVVVAYDGNYLLDGGTIPALPGSTGAEKYGTADDLMKTLVKENIGVWATDTARYKTRLTVQDSMSLAVGVAVSCGCTYLLDTLRKICQESITGGTYCTFDTVSTPTGVEFRTYTGQRGQNRGVASGAPLYIGSRYNNFANAVMEEYHRNERNAVYVFGGGFDETIPVVSAVSGAATRSIWARRESLIRSMTTGDLDVMADEANRAVRENRAYYKFSGDVVENTGFIYGIDFDYGDIVVIEEFGLLFDGRVSSVKVDVGEDGSRKVQIQITAEW